MTNSHVVFVDYLLAVLEVKMNKIFYAIIPILAFSLIFVNAFFGHLIFTSESQEVVNKYSVYVHLLSEWQSDSKNIIFDVTNSWHKLDKINNVNHVFDAEFKENELKMREQIKIDAAEMLKAGGLANVEIFDEIGGMGKGIHEMGTARMGRNPKTSVLNGNNQIHAVSNVYITDGACMTSSSCVNPSITYMALTARAVNHAIKESI